MNVQLGALGPMASVMRSSPHWYLASFWRSVGAMPGGRVCAKMVDSNCGNAPPRIGKLTPGGCGICHSGAWPTPCGKRFDVVRRVLVVGSRYVYRPASMKVDAE